MITIAIIEKDYKKAKEIGSRTEFLNKTIIQTQMAKVAMLEREVEEKKEIKNTDKSEKQNFLNKIKTQIYYNKIYENIIEQINQNQTLSNYEKALALLAVCEKRKTVKHAEKLIAKIEISEELQKKEIRKIIARMKSKKTSIFDFGKYDELLGWNFDEQLMKEYEEARIERQNEKTNNQEANEKKSDNSSSQKAHQESISKQNDEKALEQKNLEYLKGEPNTIVTTHYEKNSTQNVELHKKQHKKRSLEYLKVKPNTTSTISTEKSRETNKVQEILQYLSEKRKDIYIKLQSQDERIQKQGIEQWDKMENLIYKVKSQKEN